MAFTRITTALAALSLLADALVATVLVSLMASRCSAASRERWSRLRRRAAPFALPSAFVVAAIAMSGSLYLSEIAGLIPCKLCWYQRICLYPLTPLLGIAMFRRDLYTAKRYLVPLASIGAIISAYHYQLERIPHQPALSCGFGEPSCAQAVLNIFGFVSVPFMALAAFLLVVTMVVAAHEPDAVCDIADGDGQVEVERGSPGDPPLIVHDPPSTLRP